MSSADILSALELEWVYVTDDFIAKLRDDAYIEQLFKDIVPDRNYADNDRLSEFFYEFIYCFTEFERFSTKDGISFINSFLRKSNRNSVDRPFAIVFIQMINLFQSSVKMETLLRNLTLHKAILGKYLRSDLLKSSKLVDNYLKKLSNYMKDQSRVKNYNLLHECAEGYSKLIVELYEAVSSKDAYYMVGYVNKVILKLIGTFNLDPTRVLDIVLDIFVNNILKNYRFCINLLKQSTWWPIKDSRHIPQQMGSLTEGGSDIGAQLLGLKLLNYYYIKKNVPETLKCLIVILIKEGFISLASISHYLLPDNLELVKLEDHYNEYMEDKILKASASALSLAAPLKDEEESDSKSSGGGASSAKDSAEYQLPASYEDREDILAPLGKKTNFKYEFLKYFLLCGLYDESIYLLTKFPILSQINDEIPDLIHRMLNVCVDDFYYQNYHPVKDLKNKSLISKAAKIAYPRDNHYVDYEDYAFKNIEIFKLHPSYADKRFIFFYREWDKHLPKVSTVDQLITVCHELLSFSGSKISNDPELIAKLVRIGNTEVQNYTQQRDDGKINKEEFNNGVDKWFQFFRKFIFIAIPLLGTNAPIIDEIFQLFQLFPINKRYNLYGELEMRFKKRNLYINLEYDQATKKTKDGLKRLSKTNANIIMRNLSKIAISNPLPFFQVITTQVESYDNLIDLIVQSAKYFNEYAWDVLSYVLLTRLTSRRNIVQKDGLNDRLWLQNLANFIGKLCLTFATRFNAKILTEFIIKRFYEYDNITIILFKELLNNVSGVASISNLTLKQIELLNSGDSVAKTVYKVIFDQRFTKLNIRASTKYLTGLAAQDIDSGLHKTPDESVSKLSELFILLTNYYSNQVFLDRSNENHSKILSNRNDELNGLIHTYITMLNYFEIRPEFLQENLLSLEQLLVEFNVDIEWVFDLWRKTFSKQISEEYRTSPRSFTQKNPWSKTLVPIMNSLKGASFYNTVDWKFLNNGLFVSFWQLSLYDINYHAANYDIKEKLETQIKVIDNIISNPDTLKSVVREKRIERYDLRSILANLDKDKEAHEKHCELVKKRIDVEKKHWFNTKKDITKQAEQFVEHCLLPRIVHCSFDAVFCAKFIILLHDLGFHELFEKILSILFSSIISTTIFTSTPLEAENFGLFYSKVFEFLDDLRTKKQFFKIRLGVELLEEKVKEKKEVELLNYADNDIEMSDSAAQSLAPSSAPASALTSVPASSGEEPKEGDSFVKEESNEESSEPEGTEIETEDDENTAIYNEYRFKLLNWHKAAVREISLCLYNDDYMFRRNSITFLKNLLGVFPSIVDHCEELLAILQDIFKHDKREDIRLASNALLGHMKARSKRWIRVYDFYKMPKEEKQQYIEEQKNLLAEKKRLEEEVQKITKSKVDEEAKAKEFEEEEQRAIERDAVEKQKAEQKAAEKVETEKREQKRQEEKKQIEKGVQNTDVETEKQVADAEDVEMKESERNDVFDVKDNAAVLEDKEQEDTAVLDSIKKGDSSAKETSPPASVSTTNTTSATYRAPQPTIASEGAGTSETSRSPSEQRAPRPGDKNPKFVDVLAPKRGKLGPATTEPSTTASSPSKAKRPRENSVEGSVADDSPAPDFKKRKTESQDNNTSKPAVEAKLKNVALEQVNKLRKAIESKSYKEVVQVVPIRKYQFDLRQFQHDYRSTSNRERISRIFTSLIEDICKNKDVDMTVKREVIGSFDDLIYGSGKNNRGSDSKGSNSRDRPVSDIRSRLAREKELNKQRQQNDRDNSGDSRYPKKDSYRTSYYDSQYNGAGSGNGGNGGSGSGGGRSVNSRPTKPSRGSGSEYYSGPGGGGAGAGAGAGNRKNNYKSGYKGKK